MGHSVDEIIRVEDPIKLSIQADLVEQIKSIAFFVKSMSTNGKTS